MSPEKKTPKSKADAAPMYGEGSAPIDQFVPDPENVRPVTAKSVESLAASIRDVGLLNPIIVRPMPGQKTKMLVVSGHRRLAACRAAGVRMVKYRVATHADAPAVTAIAAAENLERAELSPLQEAAAVSRMVAAGRTLKAIADAFGRPLEWVARRSRLSTLTPDWKKKAADPARPESRWDVDTLVKIARLEPAAQARLDARLDKWDRVHEEQVRRIASEETRELAEAPFPTEDAALAASCKALPCARCPKRSDANPGLFDPGEVKDGSRCMDAACFDAKRFAHLAAQASRLGKTGVVVGEKDELKGAKLPADVRMVTPWSTGPRKPIADPAKVPAGYVAGVDAETGRFVAVKLDKDAVVDGKKAGVRKAGQSLTMAEKMKGLEFKRLRAVAAAISETLGKAKTIGPHCSLEALAALCVRYGTRTSGTDEFGLPGMKGFDGRKAVDELFRQAAAECVRQWRYVREPDPEELKAVAATLGLNWSRLVADAEVRCPVPRAWAADVKPAKRKGK